MTTKLSVNNLDSQTLDWLSGPRITSIQIADSQYNALNDAAVDVNGGYILINGNDFSTSPQVLIDNIPATSISRISDTLIRAQVPASSAVSYSVQVINTDGSSAILVNGLTYSSIPAWITGSSLSAEGLSPLNIILSANEAQNSAITYALAAANTLPTGTTLYSNGRIQGAVSVNANATYNFSILANDAQNQDATRAFSLTTTTNTPPNWSFQLSNLPIAQPVNYYSNTIVAVDPAIASYTITSGSLPPGLTLDYLTGEIFGNPTVSGEGSYNLQITATDTAGLSATKSISITVTSVGFNSVVLLLKTNTTNLANNHAFIDSSENNLPLVRNGDATQGTFSPFSQTGWSNYFNGNGNYLSTAAGNVRYNPGSTGAWTFETWVYPIESGAFYGVGGGSTYSNSMACYWNSGTRKFTFLQGNGSSNPVNMVPSITHPEGSWYHYAVCKDSNNFIRMFINGVMVAYKSYSSSITSGNRPVINGTNDNNGLGNGGANCYISNLRWIKGDALYASNTSFTPPTAPLTATGNCNLLFAQSNRFLDSSQTAAAFTTIGGSPSVQAFSPFQPTTTYGISTVGGSAYFDGTGDYVQTVSNAAFNLGTGNFTLEFFVYPLSGSQGFITRQSSNSGWNNIQWYLSTDAGGGIVLAISDGGNGYNAFATAVIPSNAWSHCAVVRNTGVWYFYLNGVSEGISVGTGYNSSMESNATGQPLNIGGFPSWAITAGYLFNVRLVKGVAVYSGTRFTPPIAPLSISGALSASAYPSTANVNTSFASSCTAICTNFTNVGIYDATSRNNFITQGAVNVSTTQTLFSNTTISFGGSGDGIKSSNKLFDMGTTDFTIETWAYVTELSTYRGVFQISGGTNGYSTTITNSLGIDFRPANAGFEVYAKGSSNSVNYSVALNTWYHLAVVRSGTTTTFYVGGEAAATYTSDTTNYTGPYIGIGNIYNATYPFLGNMADFRITRRAVYTSNFTPPTRTFGLI